MRAIGHFGTHVARREEEGFFFLFFLQAFTSMCNPLGYDRLQISLLNYILWPSFMPFSLSIYALSRRHNCCYCNFGVAPSWVYPINSSSLGRSSAPILVPFLLPLLSLLRLSFSRILVAVLPIFHFVVSWLTIFSRPGLAIKLLSFSSSLTSFFVIFSTSGIWCTNAQSIVLSLYTISIQGVQVRLSTEGISPLSMRLRANGAGEGVEKPEMGTCTKSYLLPPPFPKLQFERW